MAGQEQELRHRGIVSDTREFLESYGIAPGIVHRHAIENRERNTSLLP